MATKVPTAGPTSDDIKRLPRWAQYHVASLNHEIATLRAALDGQPPRGDAWLIKPPHVLRSDLPTVVLADAGTRVARVLLPAGYLEISPEGSYLSVRAERSLIVQPQSGNVIKLANSEWLV